MKVSKTWIISFVSMLVLQYAPVVEQYVPQLVAYLAGVLPEPFNALVGGIVPPLIAWLVTVVISWARNQGVKDATVVNPATGLKVLWKK